jgi:hypothetical protein
MQSHNNENFSAEQSLKLITEMIEETKNSISDRSHYFLLWGYAIVVGSLLQYYLKVVVNSPYHPLAWLITVVVLVVHFIFAFRDSKQEKVRTAIGNAVVYLWVALGLSFCVFSFIFTKIGWQYCYPFYILAYGIGVFVSGGLIKFKPLIIGGLLCFPLAAATVYLDFDAEILMLALAVIVSYIIPGHLLRAQYKARRRQAAYVE